jgi:hypothetical protein
MFYMVPSMKMSSSQARQIPNAATILCAFEYDSHKIENLSNIPRTSNINVRR